MQHSLPLLNPPLSTITKSKEETEDISDEFPNPLFQKLLIDRKQQTSMDSVEESLLQTLDITGELNKTLVNRRELLDYLTAKGTWKYPKMDLSEEEIAALKKEREIKDAIPPTIEEEPAPPPPPVQPSEEEVKATKT